MVHYEVNLEIKKNLYEKFLEWLDEHVLEILNLNGFKQAQIFEENNHNSTDYYKLTVRYELDTMSHLQHYFDNHAKIMQNKTNETFGKDVKASRRILKLNKILFRP